MTQPLTPEDRNAANELAKTFVDGTDGLGSVSTHLICRALLDRNAEVERLTRERDEARGFYDLWQESKAYHFAAKQDNSALRAELETTQPEIRKLTGELETVKRGLREANEALGSTVTVTVGTSCLTRDLVWCGGCARGISRSGNWYHCPQCGGKINQESYRLACEEAERNGGNIARYVSGEGADKIKELDAELSALRTRLETAEKDKTRVEWIEKETGNVIYDTRSYTYKVRFRVGQGEYVSDCGSLRGAIDAAMSATQPKPAKPPLVIEESLECTDRACGWVGYENQAVERHSESEGTEYDCPKCGEICAHFPLNEIGKPMPTPPEPAKPVCPTCDGHRELAVNLKTDAKGNVIDYDTVPCPDCSVPQPAGARPIHYLPELGPRSICAAHVKSPNFGEWTADARNVTCPICAGVLIRSLWKVGARYAPQPAAAETRNSEALQSFVEYCRLNPSQRLWQALRNWSKWGFILAAETRDGATLDTFNIDGLDGTRHAPAVVAESATTQPATGQTAQESPDLDERKRWREFHAAQEPKE